MNNPKFEHVAWQVADPDAMADWYLKHLDFQVVRHTGGPACVWFLRDASGRFVLEIYRNDSAPAADYRALHPLSLHLALTCEDPFAQRDRLLLVGATVETELATGKTGDTLGMLRDPWGFPIQLVRRACPMGAKRALCIGREALGTARNHPKLHPVGFINLFDEDCADAEASESVPSFDTFAAAMETATFDLVLISVPNTTKNKPELEMEILRAGVPLLCTKWRMKDWGAAAELDAVCTETGTPYFVRDHYHLSPTFQTARDHIEGIGKIRSIHYRFAIPTRPEGFNPWVHSYRHLLLEDLCYHHFAILHFLCGVSIRSAWCRSRPFSDMPSIQNALDLLAEMDTGCVLHYSGRWCAPASSYTSWPGEIIFEGENGILKVSEEHLVVNGRTLPPGALKPIVDWIAAACARLDDPESKSSCLLTLKDVYPVALAIQKCLAATPSKTIATAIGTK